MKTQTVADVMTRRVVTATADMQFKDVARLMSKHEVSGIPVVDVEGSLVGIITEADLLWANRTGTPPVTGVNWFLDRRWLESLEADSDRLTAADMMSRDVVTTTPDARIQAAFRSPLSADVRRLPVIDADRRVVGIVSRRDLLKPFLRSDAQIEQEVVDDVIRHTMWLEPTDIDVHVGHGVVTLRGVVDRRSEEEILIALIRGVPGVVGVEDRLVFRTDDHDLPTPPVRPDLGWSENWVRTQ